MRRSVRQTSDVNPMRVCVFQIFLSIVSLFCLPASLQADVVHIDFDSTVTMVIGDVPPDAGREIAGAVDAGELIGIAAVGFDPVAGLAWDLGGCDQNAVVTVGAETTAQRIAVGPGFVAEMQLGVRMGGLKFLGQP